MAVDPVVPDIPGRGHWTTTGGLLPESPGGSGPGFYRLADTKNDEIDVGSLYVTGEDEGTTARVVNLAVKAFQAACDVPVYERDGWLGPKTHAAGASTQDRFGLKPDGIFGPRTMQSLFARDLNRRSDAYMLDRSILWGIVEHGSMFDPGAVSEDGWRYGLCQLNLHPKKGVGASVSLETAMTPDLAFDIVAKQLRTVFNTTFVQTRGIRIERAWDVAILHHMSPKDAIVLRDTGKYPSDSAENYVDSVRLASARV